MLRKIFISFAFLALALAPVFAEAEGAEADNISSNYDAGGASDNQATENAGSTSEEEAKSESRALGLIGGEILPGSGFDAEKNSAESVINSFFQKTTTLLIGMTTAVAVVFLIIGGYQYLTSFGNEEQVKSAHKTIAFSLVGIILALLAFAIVQIVVNIKLEEVETDAEAAADTEEEEKAEGVCETDRAVCKKGEAKDCSELNTTYSGNTSCKDDCSGWDESKCEKFDVGDVF